LCLNVLKLLVKVKEPLAHEHTAIKDAADHASIVDTPGHAAEGAPPLWEQAEAP
jgi:hypothetical protein